MVPTTNAGWPSPVTWWSSDDLTIDRAWKRGGHADRNIRCAPDRVGRIRHARRFRRAPALAQGRAHPGCQQGGRKRFLPLRLHVWKRFLPRAIHRACDRCGVHGGRADQWLRFVANRRHACRNDPDPRRQQHPHLQPHRRGQRRHVLRRSGPERPVRNRVVAQRRHVQRNRDGRRSQPGPGELARAQPSDAECGGRAVFLGLRRSVGVRAVEDRGRPQRAGNRTASPPTTGQGHLPRPGPWRGGRVRLRRFDAVLRCPGPGTWLRVVEERRNGGRDRPRERHPSRPGVVRSRIHRAIRGPGAVQHRFERRRGTERSVDFRRDRGRDSAARVPPVCQQHHRRG